MRARGLIATAALSASALLFVSLGVWQLERRTAKLALIAAVDQRVHARAGAAPGPADWPRISAADDAYRHIRVRGVFLNDREAAVQAVSRFGPGYWVITPLKTEAGWTVLVNRGFVAPERRDRAARRAGEPSGLVTVAGLLRTSEPKGGFLRSNRPEADRWYSRDVAAIGRSRRLARLAPYFIDAETGSGGAEQPIAGLTIVAFPNNHLTYAITWFALGALSAFGALRLHGRGA